MNEIAQITEADFFVYTLPVLLTFAIVYGILSKFDLPEDKSARTIISLVLSLFILPLSEQIMGYLTNLGTGFLMIIVVLLFFMILVQMTGGEEAREVITDEHSRSFGALVILLAVVIFWGAGGFEMIGIGRFLEQIDAATATFLVVISLALYWMVIES